MRVVVVSIALMSLALTACPAEDPCLSLDNEPAYGGLGNDEVWLTLADAKENATNAGDAATITAPVDAATLPADSAPTFSWDSPLKIAMGPVLPSSPSPLHRRAPRSIFDAVSDVVIPKARAHLAPVTSDAYLVDVVIPGRQCPVSIVTSELQHTLDDDTWSAIKSAGAGVQLRLDITSAYLANGRIQEGPFAATPVAFKVE